MKINDLKERKELILEDIVTERKLPMNQEGCNVLRALRKQIISDLNEETGSDISVPFPTVIHLVLLDYARLRGIEVDE